ncbi:MAG: hypothetical protein N3D79_02060 [Acidilobaceae archaeon]|nr:hypothetical protein [Acidilobaceae archaeon]
MVSKSFGALLVLTVFLISLAAPASAQNSAEFRFNFKVPIRSGDYEMTSTSLFRQNVILSESQGKAPTTSPLDWNTKLSLIINRRNETGRATLDLFVNLFNRSDNRLNITLRLAGAADLIMGDPVKGRAGFNISLRDQGALAARINLRALAVDGTGNASLSLDERWFNSSAIALLESRSGNAVIDRAVIAFIYATVEELLANFSQWVVTVNPKAKFSYNVTFTQNRVRVVASLSFPYDGRDFQLQLTGIREYTSRTDLALRFSQNRLEWNYKYSLTSPIKLGWEGSLNATARRGVLEVSGNLKVAKENLDRARQNLAALASVATMVGADSFAIPQGQLQVPAPPQINLNRIADNLELVVESVERATSTPTPSPSPTESRGLVGLDSTTLAILGGVALLALAGAIAYYLGRRS